MIQKIWKIENRKPKEKKGMRAPPLRATYPLPGQAYNMSNTATNHILPMLVQYQVQM